MVAVDVVSDVDASKVGGELGDGCVVGEADLVGEYISEDLSAFFVVYVELAVLLVFWAAIFADGKEGVLGVRGVTQGVCRLEKLDW